MRTLRLGLLAAGTIVAMFVAAAAVAPQAISAKAPRSTSRSVHGPLGVVYHRGHNPHTASVASSANPECPGCNPPLLYTSGGAVMGGPTAPGHVTVTPVYWAPPGYSFPGNYAAIIDQYINDIAAASGAGDNVFGIEQEYWQQDAGGPLQHLQYVMQAGTELDITPAYPVQSTTTGCTAAAGYSACVSDDALQSTLLDALSANGLPIDTSHVYPVFFPPGVETCFNHGSGSSSNTECSANVYCAYHYITSARAVYANMPYAMPNGCTTVGPEDPNGNSYADVEISPLSHELSEAITDVDPNHPAWTDSAGNEDGDECAYVYGEPVGSAPVVNDAIGKGTAYNQVINGHFYFTQDEFSNNAFTLGLGDRPFLTGPVVPGCLQRHGPLAVTTTSVPDGPINGTYDTQLAATGGSAALTWSLHDGSLPVGLSLAGSGQISGTPLQSGTFDFTVEVTDGTSTALQALSITIAMLVATTNPPPAPVDRYYSTKLATFGGTSPFTWTQTGGSLPAGISMSSAGQLTGTPTVVGTSIFSVSVHDASSPPNVATATISLSVAPMTITTSALPNAPIDRTYSAKLAASGGKTTLVWSVASGTLPAGIHLATTGQFSGTPTATGTSTFTVRVHDSASPQHVATATLSITVTPMIITTASLPNGAVGKYYSVTLTLSGGKSTFTWSIVAGALPGGLTLSTAGHIGGTVRAHGTFTFTVFVHDSAKPAHTATKTLTITVP